jgi:hypothetical protein
MASATESGEVRIMAEDIQGNQFVCYKLRTDGAINAGGAPDGVLANATVDKQVKLGLAGPVCRGGWKIRMILKMDGADGIDASDCVVQIPITEDNGTQRVLNASDFGFSTDLPAASPAGQLLELGTGYTVPENARVRVGSADGTVPTVLAIEDDTA